MAWGDESDTGLVARKAASLSLNTLPRGRLARVSHLTFYVIEIARTAAVVSHRH
jgi:hypothetical protein